MEEFVKAIAIVVGVVVLIGILSALPVMLLWNWLMPEIFNLPTLTLWQALGVSFLSSILFKSSVSSSKK